MVKFPRNLKDTFSSNKGLAFIGTSDIIGAAISSIFWFILASLLLVEEYGEITYLIAIASLAQSCSVVGSSNTFMVYSSKKPELIQTLIFLSFFAAIVSSIIAFFVTQKFELIFLVFSFLILELSSTILLGKKFYSRYSKFILSQKTLQFILGIGLYFLIGFDGILIGIVLANIPLLVILLQQLKNFKLNLSGLKTTKEFIINNYVTFLISVFRRDIDKIIIAPLLGFVVLGNFAFAIQIYTILMVASTVSYKYLVPEDATGKKNKQLKKILILFSITISVISFVLSPILIEIIFPKFSESILVIQIISFTVIPGTIGNILFSKILALEQSRYLILATSIQLCVVLFGTIFLGSLFGLMGIAVSFLIAAIAHTVTLAITNYHLIGGGKFDI
tara:strand:+ start:239 stop:1411 length:1173 start_codon:yes stop_codon:yes gene_type:complete